MALQLTDLTAEERVALVTLLELVAEADQYVTDDEAKAVNRVIKTLGRKAYEEAVAEADRRFQDPAERRRFLETAIARQEARELIFETVLEVALADAPVRAETEILDWLRRTWNITMRVVKE